MKEQLILFERKVKVIVYKGETLYDLEGILKYFSIEYKHIDPLILEFKKHYLSLNVVKRDFSSSTNYYVSLVDAFRIIMCISGEKADTYKNWFLKCTIDRINEILDPNLGYDRLKTILYKKGVTSSYTFTPSEVNSMSRQKRTTKVDQELIDSDIFENLNYNLKLINESWITVVKTPRNNTTNFL